MKYATRLITLLLASFPLSGFAGNLDAPGSAGSNMPTINQIYNLLDTGAAIPAPNTSQFTEPTAGPTVGSSRTLAEIQAKLPAPDNTNGATASDVLSGKTFWGLRTDGTWGVNTGAIPVQGNVTGGNGLLTFTIPDGYYFGGKTATASVIQATGTATVESVLSGATFSTAVSTGLTGTMPNNGAVSITPGTTSQAIAAGYHNGSGTVAGDANLVAGNIRSGTSVFGISGKCREVSSTGQSTSYATGDDGAYQNGCLPVILPKTGNTGNYAVPSWVPSNSSRFTDNSNGTVTDNYSGLIWLKNASCTETVGGISNSSGKLTWANALTWSNNLSSGLCGLTDGSSTGQWRLPNVNELLSLGPVWPPASPFTSVQSSQYWSSSSSSSSGSWNVAISSGVINAYVKTYSNYVWPVRDRQ
ncbi:Protein of unknown function [Trichlorobacter thiogenes]|uniref:Lcl C-terminal domain-containing protein n=1 Tax=Trichlorobacter thiogenes TaxID=115783 RepID=A0A1T4P9U4_9BACT|nr:DUF1566 domain-containing protein [Trichlorobacter thiogenes]SJZ88006.1 Protein of unknown function [Trichlorobacter thiogenes]